MLKTLLSRAATKAWAAGVVTVLTALLMAMKDATADGSGISGNEAITAVLAGVVALGVVFGVSNRSAS